MSMIDVSNLTFGYEGSPELIFDHVGFQIDSGWKLGFTGRNGRGKTTFLRLLQGEYPYSGTISASVEFEYFPYEVANLSRTGLEVVREIAPEAEEEIAALGVEKREVVVGYQVGDNVKITDGALESFLGTVEEIDLDRSKVRVVVSMFGRETPVELELDQVEVQD